MPARIIKVYCWIVDVSDMSFSISIKDSLDVEDLKVAILAKTRHSLPNAVNENDLTVWQPVCRSMAFLRFY
jgi:hypothetical protein